MLFHLAYSGFVNGEKFNRYLKEVVLPTYRNGYFKEKMAKNIKRRFRFLSFFSKKFKYALDELEKPYEEDFNPEFVNELANRKVFSFEIFELVKTIFEYKERREYDNFNFDDSLLLSRRVQFLTTKSRIAQQQYVNYLWVMHEMHKNGNIKEKEKKEWEAKLREEGLLVAEHKTQKVDNLSWAFESTAHNAVEDVVKEPSTVLTRDIKKKRKSRFDRKREK